MQAAVVLISILIIGACTCGCTSSAPAGGVTPAAEQTPAGPVKTVSLVASSYSPEHLYIARGTTVAWINEEDRITRRVVHMPSEASGRILFESGPLSPGDSYTYTFTAPGRYVYADPQHGAGRSPFIEVT
jgi:plastocyanin